MNDIFRPKIVILSIAFRPNVGGVETHLTDLTNEIKQKDEVLVVTLPPITTKVSAKVVERDENLLIWRIPWFGKGLFNALLRWPILEFFYLTPPLFIGLLIALLKYPSIQVIHAQGFSGGFTTAILGKIFNKRTLISTAYVFHFKKDFFGRVAKWVFGSVDKVLCVSEASTEEMRKLGVAKEKLGKCLYWVNLDIFKPTDKPTAKKKVGWASKFSILFIGRLVKEKGVFELLEAIRLVPQDINFYIIGDGSLRKDVEKVVKDYPNLHFLGKVPNELTPIYYSAADVVIVPSYEETLGRVNMEALACATPVIGSSTGGLKEVVGKNVGLLFKVEPQDIAKTIAHLYEDKDLYERFRKNARAHIQKHFSSKNFGVFVKEYGLDRKDLAV